MQVSFHNSLIIATMIFLFFFVKERHSPNSKKTHVSSSKLDPSFLDDIAENIRIIALGESSHGLGSLYETKSEIIQYLHDQHGFKVLAFEASLGDILLANADDEITDAKKLRDHSVYGNFQCDEIMPLFEYLIESRASTSPLSYAGFDPQLSGGYFRSLLEEILNKYAPNMIDSLSAAFHSYYKIIPASNEASSTNFDHHRNNFTRNLNHIHALLRRDREKLMLDFKLSTFEVSVLYRTLQMLRKSMDVEWQDRFYLILRRDELMFENFVWLADTVFPNQKFIIWGHNGHIQKRTPGGHSAKFMGQLMKEKYQDQYYSLGIFVTQGNTYRHWTKDTITFDHSDPAFVESKMYDHQGYKFLDLLNKKVVEENPWVSQDMKAFEIENGGEINFIPTLRFDGLLNINKSDVPTFN